MRLHWLVGCALVACGGTTSVTTLPRGDTDEAARSARSIIEESYGELRRGDATDIQTLVAEDAVVVGPGAAQIYTTRESAIVALAEQTDREKKYKLRSRGLKVSSSPGGHAAWATDAIEFNGAEYHLTLVLVEDGGLWTAAVASLSRPIEVVTARKLAEGKKLPALSTPGGGDSAAAGLLQKGLGAPETFLEQLSDRNSVAFLGPGQKDTARGAKAIEKLWKKRQKGGSSYRDFGDARTGVTKDGTLAWVIVPAQWSVGKGKELTTMPVRLTAIYEKRGASWKLMMLHTGVAEQ